MTKALFGIGERVRFDKKVNPDVWAAIGKRGQAFKVTGFDVRDGKVVYELRNARTGSQVRWIAGSLLKKVEI